MDSFQRQESPSKLKRKRSSPQPSQGTPTPPIVKQARSAGQLQINYLARRYKDDLPLIQGNQRMPDVLRLLNDYHGVIDRHESLACNMGARPLGPILVKRFERIFEGPPSVLKAPSSEHSNITWLDVVEFARRKPDQFTLDQTSEGYRVCQFQTKHCQVQISEEDFLLIESGMPQKLIPPQPIAEDEEKELGTLEILERAVQTTCQLADQVAAKARQLNHKLRARKQAIAERRVAETSISSAQALRASSPSNVALVNGGNRSPAGFVPANARPPEVSESESPFEQVGVSQSTHDDLLRKFSTVTDNRFPFPEAPRQSPPVSKGKGKQRASSSRGENDYDIANKLLNHLSGANSGPVAMTGSAIATPQPSRGGTFEKDDGGPFKADMVARLESLAKGERISPPCDRCRRLHMGCLKNLTACVGCTKKHAKCSWREVKAEELRETPPQAYGAHVQQARTDYMPQFAPHLRAQEEHDFDLSARTTQNVSTGPQHQQDAVTPPSSFSALPNHSHHDNDAAPSGSHPNGRAEHETTRLGVGTLVT